MASYNKVILAGNITRDLESLNFGGKTVVKFGLAVNRRFTNSAGQPQEKVLFIDCTAFEKKGEVIAKFFKKGSGILIDGRLEASEWVDKTTQQKRSKIEVVVDDFSFIDSKGSSPAQQYAPPAQQYAPNAQQYAPPAQTAFDDDVPF